ncbi:hypothetical protein TCSYLVIO_010792 [Trypanosoma cruzi]|uniref:RNA-editing substrate-binding complex 6 protein domain-containing protein n=3 Tax=Trypanosoma cruzi TaxID=5693 RepID=V5BEF0_TRYCR|nr:hypothetical protein TCSYLVIO_010792 [Trypanosoma cruzi]ESS64427.1 hypothetical protein TCDM_07483 [Trypanosoma cruzi Dm28c]PBJ80161.1 MRB1-associated protein,guide RNA binding protein [Trypanosoma cruzi cruzi]KAF8278522.1 MRB1 complex subunit MRB3010 [Trypanosoma cruzi]PWU89487.1 MRB1 complex subunit MRB3010 [Trypanosoma cruzi]
MRCILRTCLHHNHHLRQRVVATTNTTNNAAAAALLFGVRCQSNSLIGTIHGGELSLPSDPQGGSQLSARNIAMEALQMKKLHQERGGNPMLAQQARRVLFATSIAGQSLDARSVALLLNTAVYFGMESDAKLVRECIDYCLKNDKLITVDVLPIVVTACATLKSRDAREVIEMQAQKAARNAKYLDSKGVANIISAFSKTGINHEKLFGFLSKRVQTLARVGEFEAAHLVIIANAFSRLRYRDKFLFGAIARRAMSLRERVTVNELVPLIVAFSKIGLKDPKLSKRFATKAMEYVDQMNAEQVASMFMAFAYFGIRYDQLFGVLTNRAVELIDEFNAQFISTTLNAFQRIGINNPELFDNLAERALAVVQDHDARDISKTVTALAHFGLKDEELFKRLASHAASIADQFDALGLVNTAHAFARTNFLQQDMAVALSERSVYVCRQIDAGEARRLLWSLAKFQVRDPKILTPVFNRCLALHQDFFSDPTGSEEIEEIFDIYGPNFCPPLYQLYVSRGTAPQM